MLDKTGSQEKLVINEKENGSNGNDAEKGIDDYNISSTDEYILTDVEKNFILSVEKGDLALTQSIIDENRQNPEFNINCLDPLNRTALVSAIENENEDLLAVLLEEGIEVGDALLHAISEEYVEAVEELLRWEEDHHVDGQPYSWEKVDRSKSDFTPDITPLILAAHRNNYEIIKILLDRGATLPTPHDVKCSCDICVTTQEADSLRYSQSRINAYRALSSSSLIALSSRDPVLTAFELSWELKHLQTMESEFRDAYTEMRSDVQEFVTTLLDHARTSLELEIMLNFNADESDTDIWMPGQRQTLDRLKLAIKYKQKSFIAHPNVQQLLAAIWYDGLPGFRRKSMLEQIVQILIIGCSFPLYCMNYIVAPNSNKALLMKKPFVKFIMHTSSYMFFLTMLAGASLRIIPMTFELIGLPWMLAMIENWKKYERGSFPGPIELFIIMYIGTLIFGELKTLYDEGLVEYVGDLWNIIDFISNQFYVTWIFMRACSFIIVHRDLWYTNINPYFPRENWHPFDPMLIGDGAFAAGMIFSFLKLVHIFSINPHLGPLQVSLGRMIIDIIKFFFIYTLVLLAFGCGFNLLLMYYAEMEKAKCYHLHPDVADFEEEEKACTVWRRFVNLFETSQSLFWASFGLVDLVSFELEGVKGFTRFWGLLMFGSYNLINIIVLLNMLIAMMSNSYQVIYEKADTEWKFARSQLWMDYFEDGDTLPPPFNVCPSVTFFQKALGKNVKTTKSFLKRTKEKAQLMHDKVMGLLVRRYITSEQKKREDYGITEDDIMELRTDVSSFRYELLDILRRNNMKVPEPKKAEGVNRKTKVLERRIKKDFQIGMVESIVKEVNKDGGQDVFSSIAKIVGKKNESNSEGTKERKEWNKIVKKNFMGPENQIGSEKDRKSRVSQRSMQRKIMDESKVKWTEVNQEQLVQFNPNLQESAPATRVAYARFMKPTLQKRYKLEGTVKNEAGDSTGGPSSDVKPITEGVLRKSTISYKITNEKKSAPPPPSDAQAKKSDAPDAPEKPEEQSKTESKDQAPPGGENPDSAGAKKEDSAKAGDGKHRDKKKPDAGGDAKVDPTKSEADGAKKAADTSGASAKDGDKSGEKPAEGDKSAGKTDSTSADKPSDKPAEKPSEQTKTETKSRNDAMTKAMESAAAGASGDRGKSVVTGKMISGWL